ncbi:MAG: hypothetical protein KBD27_02210 [Candidatus Moranbacteria bacterium]|nr:hypothetical protein [Candidatus Moranbacteria bacterium]
MDMSEQDMLKQQMAAQEARARMKGAEASAATSLAEGFEQQRAGEESAQEKAAHVEKLSTEIATLDEEIQALDAQLAALATLKNIEGLEEKKKIAQEKIAQGGDSAVTWQKVADLRQEEITSAQASLNGLDMEALKQLNVESLLVTRTQKTEDKANAELVRDSLLDA